MVGHGSDAANGAVSLQALEQVQGCLDAQVQLPGQPAPGIVHQRQAGLGQLYQAQGQGLFRPGSTNRHGRSPPWAG
ncbi:hypothetical protein D3C85_1656460 [compost metagenome]